MLIVGAGALGSSIARVLRNHGLTVDLWDRTPGLVPNMKPLAKLVPGASAVFLCVPSQAIRPATRAILPYLDRGTSVVSFAKGIEEKTRQSMDRVLASLLPKRHPFAIISGPMLASELREGKFGYGVVASSSRACRDAVAALFEGSSLRMEKSDDVRGVMLSGVLKNVYAIAVGIATGLELGENTKGWLGTEAMREMAHVLSALGGKEKTVFSTACVADFLATGWSEASRNHQAGIDLARCGECAFASEGLVSFPAVLRLLGKHVDHMPIIGALRQVIIGKKDARLVFERLIRKYA